MSMNKYRLLGAQQRKQMEAVVHLNKHDGLQYKELQQELGLEEQDEIMQEVIRGINDNGLANRTFNDSGRHIYTSEW